MGTRVIIPHWSTTKEYKLTDSASVYTTDIITIFKALVKTDENPPTKLCILADFLTSVKTLGIFLKEKMPVINEEILTQTTILQHLGRQTISQAWIPAHWHRHIKKTTEGDKAAKAGININNIINTGLGKEGKE